MTPKKFKTPFSHKLEEFLATDCDDPWNGRSSKCLWTNSDSSVEEGGRCPVKLSLNVPSGNRNARIREHLDELRTLGDRSIHDRDLRLHFSHFLDLTHCDKHLAGIKERFLNWPAKTAGEPRDTTLAVGDNGSPAEGEGDNVATRIPKCQVGSVSEGGEHIDGENDPDQTHSDFEDSTIPATEDIVLSPFSDDTAESPYLINPVMIKLVTLMCKGFNDEKKSRIYVYRDLGDERFHKVGVTERSAEVRKSEALCTRKAAQIVYETKPIRGGEHVEKLVKASFGHRGRQRKECRVCCKDHQEWFKVSEQDMIDCIEMWATFVQAPIYSGGCRNDKWDKFSAAVFDLTPQRLSSVLEDLFPSTHESAWRGPHGIRKTDGSSPRKPGSSARRAAPSSQPGFLRNAANIVVPKGMLPPTPESMEKSVGSGRGTCRDATPATPGSPTAARLQAKAGVTREGTLPSRPIVAPTESPLTGSEEEDEWEAPNVVRQLSFSGRGSGQGAASPGKNSATSAVVEWKTDEGKERSEDYSGGDDRRGSHSSSLTARITHRLRSKVQSGIRLGLERLSGFATRASAVEVDNGTVRREERSLRRRFTFA